MEVGYIVLGVGLWLVFSFSLYRRQQAKAQALLAKPEFIQQVADLVRKGQSEEEVALFLRRTYKLPVLTGRLIYRQVQKRL